MPKDPRDAFEFTPVAPLAASPQSRVTHGAHLDLRPYFIGNARRRYASAAASAWLITGSAALVNAPQVWAFTLVPALALSIAALVVAYDYARAHLDGRPRLIGRRP